MLMAVMQLGHVWVIMRQWQMPVRVCMRFLCDDLLLMLVLVVLTMHVRVIVLHLFMDMKMAMMGSQQECHTHRHEPRWRPTRSIPIAHRQSAQRPRRR